jgi:hypothetical protein
MQFGMKDIKVSRDYNVGQMVMPHAIAGCVAMAQMEGIDTVFVDSIPHDRPVETVCWFSFFFTPWLTLRHPSHQIQPLGA